MIDDGRFALPLKRFQYSLKFAISALGHTTGHFAMALRSKGKTLLNPLDTAVHHAAGLEHQTWTIEADLNNGQAVETRKRLFARAAKTGVLVAAAHFPYPGIGRNLATGDAYTNRPVKPT